jgi:2-polyprenyl-6-hydroxyphenyl methylase/3-demethylubiquinone-9 3-methyltransferase
LTTEHAAEVARGDRFAFGRNWSDFLNSVDDSRVEAAIESLRSRLGADRLDGLNFLDAGSGSGLFSLAARMLGARVHSFDYDPQSVACTEELKHRFLPGDDDWRIELGSVLDRPYVDSLGPFDITYSWGVLHHTGSMWEALENVCRTVAVGGRLFIALYNDQGGPSGRWLMLKKFYNQVSPQFQRLIVLELFVFWHLRSAAISIVRRKNPLIELDWRRPSPERGMSQWYDTVDWVGGFPFEVAKPEQVFEFSVSRGFELRHLWTEGGGHGNNEFVFQRVR